MPFASAQVCSLVLGLRRVGAGRGGGGGCDLGGTRAGTARVEGQKAALWVCWRPWPEAAGAASRPCVQRLYQAGFGQGRSRAYLHGPLALPSQEGKPTELDKHVGSLGTWWMLEWKASVPATTAVPTPAPQAGH